MPNLQPGRRCLPAGRRRRMVLVRHVFRLGCFCCSVILARFDRSYAQRFMDHLGLLAVSLPSVSTHLKRPWVSIHQDGTSLFAPSYGKHGSANLSGKRSCLPSPVSCRCKSKPSGDRRGLKMSLLKLRSRVFSRSQNLRTDGLLHTSPNTKHTHRTHAS